MISPKISKDMLQEATIQCILVMNQQREDIESCISRVLVVSRQAYDPCHIANGGCTETHSSIVWLAKDQQEDRYLTLKIIIAEASVTSSESKILRKLRDGNPEHPGRKYIQSLLNESSLEGPIGTHLCVLSEVVGCSVAESKEAATTRMFRLPVARAISAQVLMGLAYMHSCGVTHCGMSS